VVTDFQNGETLPGVNVVIKGTTQGTSTNVDGEYEINVPSLQDTLVFSFVGYLRQEIPINNRTQIDVRLQSQAVTGENVVVVGYGTQRSQDVTGSVGTVPMSNVENVPYNSPDEAITGQIAGVQVTAPTGVPGSAPQIQVRGTGAVGAGSQPLYVVDGFALPQPTDPIEARFANPLTDIPPSDIESITVLKDASATAIYGSRASNGVVVIETKSGRASDKPEINVSVSNGVSNALDLMIPEMANAREFAEFQRVVWQGRVDAGQVSEVPEIFQNPDQFGEGTDWFDVVTKTATTQRVNFSVGSGNENMRSYFSAGYTNQQGVVPGNDFERITFRANIDADLSDKIQVGLNLAPTYSIRNQPGGLEARGGPFGSALMINPLVDAFDENGDIIPFPSEAGPEVPGLWTHANPLFELNNVKDETNNFRILTNAFASYDITNNLVARSNFNIDLGRERGNTFNPSIVGGTNNPPPTVPVGSLANENRLNWLWENTINLQDYEIGPGRLSGLAGFTIQQQAQDLNATFDGTFPDDNVRTLNVASNLAGNSTEEAWSLVSFLSRINYNLFDNKFVFTGTIRTDGSSRFGDDNRWGTFPSAAMAVNLTNIDLFSGIDEKFDQLKFRTSYGITGNNQIDNFAALAVVDQADILFGNELVGGRAVTTLANRELGWEKTKEWNIGVDLSMLNNRLNFTVDGYNRNTTDLLLQREIPRSSGFQTVVQNSGSMRNRGVEFTIDATPISKDKFVWNTNFNFARNRNKITSLPDGEPIFSGIAEGQPTHITRVGEPIGQFFGFIIDGIFQTQQEIDNNPSFPGQVPGNLRYRDVNGDGVITAGPDGDFAVTGSPHPDFTFGTTNTLSFGRLSLRATMTGSIGGEIFRQEYTRTALNIDGLFNVSKKFANNFWRSPENPGNFNMPTPLGGGEARRLFRGQDNEDVVSNSNLWLRSATVRYNLPRGLFGTESASVYMTGTNLFIITACECNPDAQISAAGRGSSTGNNSLTPGVDFLPFPSARTFTIGLDVGF